jgi:HSP20 family protein
MALIRWRPRDEWDPFSWLSDFREEMDRLFARSLVPRGASESALLRERWSPSVDVSEDKKEVVVKADLPGMKKDEIDISVRGDLLTLKGEKKEETEVKEKNYHRIERSYGSFYREVLLPCSVDQGKIKASYKDGVLEVKLPKKEEEKGKKIQIEG